MKQKCILTLVFAGLTLQILAQTFEVSTESGVKGGALYTGLKNQVNSQTVDFQTKSGFSIGVFYIWKDIIGPINLQTEFLYQLKGVRTNYYFNAYGDGYGYGYGGGYGYNPYGYSSYGGYGYPSYQYNYNSESVNYSNTRNMENYHYFTVPLLFSVTAFKIVEIYVGPELGFKFYESDGQNLTAELNKFTAGMATGFALHLGENTKVDFRYSTDFTKVYDIEEENLKNQSFAFTVQQTLFRRLK